MTMSHKIVTRFVQTLPGRVRQQYPLVFGTQLCMPSRIAKYSMPTVLKFHPTIKVSKHD
jgi:hypothetical protein